MCEASVSLFYISSNYVNGMSSFKTLLFSDLTAEKLVIQTILPLLFSLRTRYLMGFCYAKFLLSNIFSISSKSE